MKIAVAQFDITLADLPANIARVSEAIQRAGQKEVGLLVVPECALTGYGFTSRDEALRHALSTDDETFSQLATAAGAAGLTLCVGTLIRDADELFNSAFLIDGTGVLARYDKTHLPGLGVDQFVDRGRGGMSVTEIAGGVRVGMAICYDCSFPEPMRVLALGGADVIALPTNWPVAAHRTAEVIPAARSIENHVYFAAANRIGRERGFTFGGQSSLHGPDANVLAFAGDGPEMLIAQIDVSHARNKTIHRPGGGHVIDRMADRQPQFYASLLEDL